jgi:hypothetical protein
MGYEVTPASRAMKLVNGSTWKGRRKHKRKPVLWAARIEAEEGSFDCVAFDLSLGGAKLRLKGQLALHRPAKLVLERFGAVAAEAVWRRAGTVGLRFTDTPEEVGRIIGDALPL